MAAPGVPDDGPAKGSAVVQFYTVGELRNDISLIDGDARIFVYVGADGVKVQAEPQGQSAVVLISAPSVVPAAGGHAVPT